MKLRSEKGFYCYLYTSHVETNTEMDVAEGRAALNAESHAAAAIAR